MGQLWRPFLRRTRFRDSALKIKKWEVGALLELLRAADKFRFEGDARKADSPLYPDRIGELIRGVAVLRYTNEISVSQVRENGW